MEENIALITLTESHLNENFKDGEVSIEGYTLYRADRSKGVRKGGVITYVRNDIAAGIDHTISDSIGNVEYMVLDIPLLNLLHVAIYRPPTAEFSDFEKVILAVRSQINASSESMPNIMVTGDLNLPNICWNENSIKGGALPLKKQATLLLKLFDDYFVEQYVGQPTRGENILDIVATNDPDLIAGINIEDTSMSDHRLVIVRTCFGAHKPKGAATNLESGFRSLNFWYNNIDWESMKDELSSIDWCRKFQNKSPEKIYEMLLEKLLEVAQKYVPPKTFRRFTEIPRDRRILMRKRRRNAQKLNQPTLSSAEKKAIEKTLCELEHKLLDSHNAENVRRENEAIDKIEANPKYFFKYARSRTTVKSPIGPLVLDGKYTSNPKEMSNILQHQFESVYSTPVHTTSIDQLIECPGPRCLEDLEISTEDIRASIVRISPSASAGPDGVPAMLLRSCVEEIKFPLLLLWRSSIREGRFPESLKLSRVIPIHKGGPRCEPGNYRPISLTSHISKILERVVVIRLIEYFNNMNLFNPTQHGFRQGRSCLSQLLEHHQRILLTMEGGKDTDIIYLDFAKAFDKVDYSILVAKLKSIGIGGNLLKWLNSFLIGRKQVVSVGGQHCEESDVVSGVPQGSSLGPILFLVHISDIDVDLNYVKVSSFADDTRLCMEISNTGDHPKLQSDLNSIYTWASDNNMKFNGKKFELLRYSLSAELPDVSYLTPDGQPINQVRTVRDLGVTMQDSASFECHLDNVCTKGRQQAGWVMRTFRTRESKPMLTLYKAMVLPHLEYCCQLWSPIKVGNILKLEAIQRSFTSKIREVTHLNYWERLEALGLYSLERRRERYIIIYVFKILSGLVPNFELERFKITTHESDRRGKFCDIPPLNTRATMAMKTKVDSSFPIKGARLFNALPLALRNYEGSIDSFKAKLDSLLKSVPDKPLLPNYPRQSVENNSIISQIAHRLTHEV